MKSHLKDLGDYLYTSIVCIIIGGGIGASLGLLVGIAFRVARFVSTL